MLYDKKWKAIFSLIAMTQTTLVVADHFPKELIIIGDSLSDSGNSRPSLFIQNAMVFDRYAPITDGTTWPVILAQELEAKTLTPSSQGGTNFAFVGALTSGSFVFFPNPSLTQQEQSLSSKLNRNSPVFVFGGANNIFFDPATTHPGDGAAIDVANILQDLHDKHFKNLVVFHLPDLGKLPSAGASAAEYTFNSLLFNSVLQQQLEDKSFPVIQVDLFSVFNALIADPQAFGLNNSTGHPDPAPLSGTPPGGFVFWYDGTHPSEASHQLIADYVFSILSAAECYATLAELPFSVLREQRTNIHQQLAPMQPPHQIRRIYPFVSGSYSPQLLPPFSDSCDGHDTFGGDVCVGLTDRITDAWTVGVAGTYALNSSECHERRNKCEFDLNAGILSLFAGFNRKHGYVNGIFNVAWLDYDDIKRKFHTGPHVSRAHGDTNGIDYDAEVYGAYYIWSYASFRTGPMADLNFQRVMVDGYKESGADFGNLRYKDQGNSIFATGLGWEANANFDFKGVGFFTDLFITANRQWLGKERHIHLAEVSIPESDGAWPVRAPRNTFVSAGINFSTIFKNQLIASIGYTINAGTFDMSEHFFTAGLTMPVGKKKSTSKTKANSK